MTTTTTKNPQSNEAKNPDRIQFLPTRAGMPHDMLPEGCTQISTWRKAFY